MEHKLKILPRYFKEVQEGNKTFEIRKNDRGFKVGDALILKEYKSELIMKSEDGEERWGNPHYTGKEISKEVSYIFEGVTGYGLRKGYCILGLKNTGIELKNIDLTGISIQAQTQKAIEEDNELIEAIAKRDKYNAIEEFWDCVQVRLGALQIALRIKAQEVMEGYPKHLEKLKNRPRNKKVGE